MTLLDGHPDLLVYPQEPHITEVFLSQYHSNEQRNAALLERSPLLKRGSLIGIEDFEDNVFDRKRYRHELVMGLERDSTLRGAFSALMTAYAAATGQSATDRRWWVFNEANRGRFCPWLFATFEQVRVIHIIREPRAHFQSVRAHELQAGQPISRWGAMAWSLAWAYSVEQAEFHQKAYGNSRYLIVRYDDLVVAREDVVRTVADFLEVPFHPNLLVPTKVGVRRERPAGEAANCDEFGDRIVESRIGQWMTPVGWLDSFLIETCCSALMKTHDYPLRHSGWVRRLASMILSRFIEIKYHLSKAFRAIFRPHRPHDVYRADRAEIYSRKLPL